jgi:predicted O-methyltransferase YrrM
MAWRPVPPKMHLIRKGVLATRQGGKFAVQLWKNKHWVRRLLDSPNCSFISRHPPGHFYSPIPDLGELLEIADEVRDVANSYNDIDLNESGQLLLLTQFGKTYAELPFAKDQRQEYRYYFDNPFFSYGDGVVLYSMMRAIEPQRVVEVGSGFSSAAMLDIAAKCFDSKIAFTFIDPNPECLHSLLNSEDRDRSTILTREVQKCPSEIFAQLDENDILFVDSSHVGKARSDLLDILFRVLPLLKRGVVVHFHDILWPFEYPRIWFQEGRAWNEAYFIRSFLQYNSSFEILFFNSFMAAEHETVLRATIPISLTMPSFQETIGNSSLWLRKTV